MITSQFFFLPHPISHSQIPLAGALTEQTGVPSPLYLLLNFLHHHSLPPQLSRKHPPHPAPVLHIYNLISDPLQVATELGAFFSQVSSGSHLSPHFSSLKSDKERTPFSFSLSSTELYNAPFSSSEIYNALAKTPFSYFLILPSFNIQ